MTTSPVETFKARLATLLEEAQHDEIWGLKLSTTIDAPTCIVLQKYLRANANDVDKAYNQLLETLKWRKSFGALATKDETHPESFKSLGYIIQPTLKDKSTVVTFNIYGAVKEPQTVFGDLEKFLRWRVALMEIALAELFKSTSEPVPNYGEGSDPYQMYQVHDYLNVSFLRMDPAAKAASKATIDLFSKHYPELLSRKFFVNVPYVMSWLFMAIKMALSAETVRKFSVLSYANNLATEMGTSDVPAEYGGTGKPLAEIGLHPLYA